MRAIVPARPRTPPAFEKVVSDQRGEHRRLLAPLFNLAESSDFLIGGIVGEFRAGEELFHIPRFIFMGPRGGGDTIRLGIFAAIRGDEPQSAEAVVSFLEQLERQPELAAGYHIYAYPVCNPSGFAVGARRNAAGQDLPAHFWRGSDQPEVYYLERELGVHRFQGVISLGGAEADGPRYFFSGGQHSILPAALASPAMRAARMFLADSPPQYDRCKPPRPEGRSSPAGFLTTTDELRPAPFEINFEIPRQEPRRTHIAATTDALKSVLDRYRSLLAIQQNL